MKRYASAAIAALLLGIALVLTLPLAGNRFLLALGLTTAGPPEGMMSVRTESMEPVTLIQGQVTDDRRDHGFGTDPDKAPKIIYEIPGPYIDEIMGRKTEEGYKAGFTLAFWASDMVPPLLEQAKTARLQEQCPDPPSVSQNKGDTECGKRLWEASDTFRRRKNGDRAFLLRLPGQPYRTDTMQKIMGAVVPKPSFQEDGTPDLEKDKYYNRPCIVKDDPVTGLRTFEPPLDQSVDNFCGYGTYGTRGVFKDGAHFGPRDFVKFNPDGSYKFSARCFAYTDDPNTQFANNFNCRIHTAFGPWPVELHVASQRAETWDSLVDRSLEFLERHVVKRINH